MALWPRLSVAVTVILSVPGVVSVSVSVVRSAFTWLSVPTMVRVCPSGVLVIVPPPPVADVIADSTPFLSLSVTVKISPLVLLVSDTLTPEIAPAVLITSVCVGAGTAITGDDGASGGGVVSEVVVALMFVPPVGVKPMKLMGFPPPFSGRNCGPNSWFGLSPLPGLWIPPGPLNWL